MTTKLLSLAGLLLMLSSPAFAAPATEQAVQVPSTPEPTQTVQAPQPHQLLAWQRVGSPISLET
jgi:hypothetical protein